jgi:hypothetical protein
LLATACGFLVAVLALAVILALRFQPVAHDYFVSTLERRYKSDVELGSLQISVLPAIHATGDNLVLWFNGRHDVPPMVRIRRFTLDASLLNFFRNPKHIGSLRLEGLQIHLPPRPAQPPSAASTEPRPPAVVRSAATAAFILDEVIADGTTVEITPKDPSKNPLMFDIQKLSLRTIGMGLPMTFQAELNNPKPPGFIHCEGQFGPWDAARPVDTAISGKYTFRNADLSVFKGISGNLASDGTFTGQLDRMEVAGTTDIPDFALTSGIHPMALHTDFQATVDGTDGNTILHPVRARLGKSAFEVAGAIERGALETRKTILLDAKTVTGSPARLEDFLRLSVKSAEPPMTGGIRFDTKVKLPPGDTPVIDRLQLDGTFGLNGVKFTSADVQGKIASLSHHAQGDPNDHDSNVTAEFQGSFHLHNGQLGLPDLGFTVPGARVNIQGSYILRSGVLDFRGTAKLDATVSQMTTGLKSKMLKLVDPLFRRDGAGTVIPIVISGTRGQPSFRLDIGRVFR